MLAIAGQTAGPNRPTLFNETMGTPGVKKTIFQNSNFLIPRATPGTSAS